MRRRDKENHMDVSFVSRYERRVAFVKEVIAENSTLDDDVARELCGSSTP